MTRHKAIHKKVLNPFAIKQESSIPNPIKNKANPITRFNDITAFPAYYSYYAGKRSLLPLTPPEFATC